MNILIIENEIYLAQSIASKLSDLSHNCDISSSTKEGLKGTPYDVVLLSTNISGQDIYPVIEAMTRCVILDHLYMWKAWCGMQRYENPWR